MPSGSVYELAILLTLKDLASGGFNRVETRLRSLGKEGQATLKTFNDLRSDLKKDLAVAGVGVGMLTMLRGGIKDAGNYESAVTDLRVAISQLSEGGTTDAQRLQREFGALERIGIRLGNTLPGSTQDFFEMFTALRQGGLQTKDIIDGAGESVARLAVATHNVPKELATDYAQLAIQFKLGADEYGASADLLAKLHGAIGFQPEKLIEGAKFAQLRGGLPLGMRGMKGFETMATLLASLKMSGLEGGIGGRELASLIFALSPVSKAQQKADVALKAKGIDLKFFDKGEFLGAENMIKQLEKLNKLSAEERLTLATKRFGSHEAVGPAVAFAEAGSKGYDELMKRERAALPLQEKVNQITSTYNSKLENLHGTIENLTATAFMPMLNTLKPILDFSNQTVGSLQEWSKTNPGITQTVGALVGMGGLSLTLVGGIGALTTAWRLWRIASSVGVNEAGQLTFLRTLRTESSLTAATMEGNAARVGLYSRTIGRIPSAVTTTIALVGVEYAITKAIELKGAIDDYERAKAGEKHAGEMSLKSLAALQADYEKRGERVPAEVYSGRATTVIASLNREGQFRESLEPGGHMLREMGRFFTMAPLNPYVSGPGATFDPRAASYAFKERAPELANAEVMRAFIAELGKFKLPAEQQGQFGLADIQRKEIANALQMAFPESYNQATLAATKGLTDLQQPLNVLPTSLTKANDAATRLSNNFDRFSNRLAGFELPTIPSVMFQPGAPQSSSPAAPAPGESPYKLFPKTSFAPRASVTPGVEFTPEAARAVATPNVEFSSEATRAILTDRGAVARNHQGPVVHHHQHNYGDINIHVPPGATAADDPQELARLVAYEMERQSERA